MCWWIDSIFSLSKVKGHLWSLLTATAGLSRPQQGERSLFPQRTDTLWWLHLIKRGCWSLCYDPFFFFGNHSKCSQMPMSLLLPANKIYLYNKDINVNEQYQNVPCAFPRPFFCLLMDWMMEGKHMLSRLNPNTHSDSMLLQVAAKQRINWIVFVIHLGLIIEF